MLLAPPGATRNRAAFTLLELLAVVVIFSLLAALVLGVGRYALERGKIARARSELAALSAGLENYRRTYGDYPPTDDEVRLLQSVLGLRGPGNELIGGPTLIEPSVFTVKEGLDPFTDPRAVLIDPWGRPYVYAYRTQAPWTNPAPVLYSCGSDGGDEPLLLSGGYPDRSAIANADNLYANP